eukprot:357990-Chlamydomonas_euryale.AAC.2
MSSPSPGTSSPNHATLAGLPAHFLLLHPATFLRSRLFEEVLAASFSPCKRVDGGGLPLRLPHELRDQNQPRMSSPHRPALAGGWWRRRQQRAHLRPSRHQTAISDGGMVEVWGASNVCVGGGAGEVCGRLRPSRCRIAISDAGMVQVWGS